ncbi:MAG: FG-GAP-like repeat-containing protein [Bacteroidota bacterium]
MKSSLYSSLLSRLKNKHNKLSIRFEKSLKEGEFQKQRYRKRRDAVERLKGLEKRIQSLSQESGFRLNLNYKHWAVALALGAVVASANPVSAQSTVQFAETLILGNPLPNTVARGDLDGDGDEDIVYASYIDDPIVFINEENFNFSRFNLAVDSNIKFSVKLFDLDGDGDLDIFFQGGANEAYTHSAFINDGSASFTQQPATLPLLDIREDLRWVGDLDGDGDLDFVSETRQETSPYNDYVTVFTNNALDFSSTTTFPGTYSASPSSRLRALMDFDGDNDLDIVYTANLPSSPGTPVQVLLNDGAGGFSDSGSPSYIYNQTIDKTDTLDVDGDGNTDIINVNNANNDITFGILRNDGSGETFSEESTNVIARNQDAREILPIDINGDGRDEFVLNSDVDSTFVIISIAGAGLQPYAKFEGISIPALLDSDADADLVFRGSEISLYENTGSGNFEFNSSLDLISSVAEIDTADVDVDGDLDFATAGSLASRVWINDGMGNFGVGQEIGKKGSSIAFGNLDADPEPEMVIGREGSRSSELLGFEIWDNTDGVFTLAQTLDLGSFNGRQVFVENIDDDADLEILVFSEYRGDGSNRRLRAFNNTGGLNFENTFSTYLKYEAESMDVGDIDGDLDLDVVVAADEQVIADTEIWSNDGTGSFSRTGGFEPSTSNETSVALLADFDGDNDLDLFTSSETEHKVWTNENGSFTESLVLPSSVYSTKSTLGDIDNDGDVDIIFGASLQPPIIFLNDGVDPPSFTQDVYLPLVNDGYSAGVIADIDGDGDNDVIYGGEYTGLRVVLNDMEPQTPPPILESDSLALVALYNATAGDAWTDNTNWLEDSQRVDTWFGVTVEDTRVTKLFLSNNNLAGTLPSEIGDLTALTDLALSRNALTGSIPPEIGDTRLDTLILSSNQLSGTIPEELYDLDDLIRLSISQNELTGTISSSIGNLNDLRFIALWDNPFTGGTIPGEFWTLTDLEFVYLGTSDLGGDISDFTSLTNLKDFWVDQGNFTGTISSQVENLTQLKLLDVSDNLMTGTIPPELASLSNLKIVELQNNEFTELPDLSATLDSLTVNGNFFDFADLEPNVSITKFIYEPQNDTNVPLEISINGAEAVAAVDTSGSVLDMVEITALTGEAPSNEYTWFLNGNADTEQSEITFEIPALGSADVGTYVVEVSNLALPDLTFTSDPFELQATAAITLNAVSIEDSLLIDDDINAFLFSLNEEVADTVEFAGDPNLNVPSATFTFPEVVLGEYLVAAESTEPFLSNGEQIPGAFITTFFGDAFLSRNADTLRLNADTTLQIVLQEIPEVVAGEGVVSGTIEEDFPDEEQRVDARRRAKKRKCGLRRRRTGGRIAQAEDDEFELIAYGETNDNGEFNYGFLPQGTYQFFVEYPGIPLDESAFVEFEIGPAGISDDEFVLAVFASPEGIEIQFVLGVTSDYFVDLNVYPNPTADILYIKYSRLQQAQITMEVLDLEGRVLHTKELSQAEKQTTFDTSILASGQYLVRFRGKAAKKPLVYRIIKR